TVRMGSTTGVDSERSGSTKPRPASVASATLSCAPNPHGIRTARPFSRQMSEVATTCGGRPQIPKTAGSTITNPGDPAAPHGAGRHAPRHEHRGHGNRGGDGVEHPEQAVVGRVPAVEHDDEETEGDEIAGSAEVEPPTDLASDLREVCSPQAHRRFARDRAARSFVLHARPGKPKLAVPDLGRPQRELERVRRVVVRYTAPMRLDDGDLFRRIQDRVAIVGIGHLPFAKDIGRPIGDTSVEAIQLALADAGLDAEDLDGMSMLEMEDTHEISIARRLRVRQLTWRDKISYAR